MQCNCYKNWFMMDQCRIPGDKVTSFPIECHLDQVGMEGMEAMATWTRWGWRGWKKMDQVGMEGIEADANYRALPEIEADPRKLSLGP